MAWIWASVNMRTPVGEFWCTRGRTLPCGRSGARLVDHRCTSARVPCVLERGKLLRTARAERELAFANTMRELHARERSGGCAKGLHGQHWRASSLDRAMVLLDDVVKISAAADLNGLPVRIL